MALTSKLLSSEPADFSETFPALYRYVGPSYPQFHGEIILRTSRDEGVVVHSVNPAASLGKKYVNIGSQTDGFSGWERITGSVVIRFDT